jgi:hypothetical protein
MYNNWARETESEVSYVRFKRISEAFNKLISDSILDASEGFKMPYGLGYVRIIKYKPKTYTSKSLSVDYKSSKAEGKTIYHLNEHSDGYKFRLYWSKLPQTFPDRYRYQLKLIRANKRKLAQLIFNHKDYINIDDIQVYKM